MDIFEGFVSDLIYVRLSINQYVIKYVLASLVLPDSNYLNIAQNIEQPRGTWTRVGSSIQLTLIISRSGSKCH